MTPRFSINDISNCLLTDIITFCDGRKCFFFIFVILADFFDLAFSEFGEIVRRPFNSFARRDKANTDRMFYIFRLSEIFEIKRSVIKAISVFMVNLKSFWFRANKSTCDDCSDEKLKPCYFSINSFIKSNARISLPSFWVCRNSWSERLSCFISYYVAIRRNAINAFKIFNRKYFMCHDNTLTNYRYFSSSFYIGGAPFAIQ